MLTSRRKIFIGRFTQLHFDVKERWFYSPLLNGTSHTFKNHSLFDNLLSRFEENVDLKKNNFHLEVHPITFWCESKEIFCLPSLNGLSRTILCCFFVFALGSFKSLSWEKWVWDKQFPLECLSSLYFNVKDVFFFTEWNIFNNLTNDSMFFVLLFVFFVLRLLLLLLLLGLVLPLIRLFYCLLLLSAFWIYKAVSFTEFDNCFLPHICSLLMLPDCLCF